MPCRWDTLNRCGSQQQSSSLLDYRSVPVGIRKRCDDWCHNIRRVRHTIDHLLSIRERTVDLCKHANWRIRHPIGNQFGHIEFPDYHHSPVDMNKPVCDLWPGIRRSDHNCMDRGKYHSRTLCCSGNLNRRYSRQSRQSISVVCMFRCRCSHSLLGRHKSLCAPATMAPLRIATATGMVRAPRTDWYIYDWCRRGVMGNRCRIYIRATVLVDSLHMDYQLFPEGIGTQPYGSVAYIRHVVSRCYRRRMDSRTVHSRMICL